MSLSLFHEIINKLAYSQNEEVKRRDEVVYVVEREKSRVIEQFGT